MTRAVSSCVLRVVGVVALCLLGACGRQATTAATAPGEAGPVSSRTASPAPLSSTAPPDDHGHEDNGVLTPARRTQLGVAGPGVAQPLTPQQWTEPEAVAARFVLADTTYSAAEEPTAVNTRRAAYATPRLAADLATSSSGAARLEELRRRQARFVGEVLTITTSEASDGLAVVRLRVAVTLTTADQPVERRVRFYQLTLGRDSPTGRWLVARAEQS